MQKSNDEKKIVRKRDLNRFEKKLMKKDRKEDDSRYVKKSRTK
jgi:hypothetical protein